MNHILHWALPAILLGIGLILLRWAPTITALLTRHKLLVSAGRPGWRMASWALAAAVLTLAGAANGLAQQPAEGATAGEANLKFPTSRRSSSWVSMATSC